MRVDIWYRYERYIEAFEEAPVVADDEGDIDHPTKKAIQEDDFNLQMSDTSVNQSSELLLENDDRVPDIEYLDVETLIRLPIHLTKLLKVNPCIDHRAYWWYTHDFARAYSEKHGVFPEGLIDNLDLMIRLITVQPLISMTAEAREVNRILWEAKNLATYLGYPTLEGFLKTACRRDIKLNGKIREGRKIRTSSRSNRRQYTHSPRGETICSSLRDLFWHYETEVSRAQHRPVLREMRGETGELLGVGSGEVYNTLYGFRNDSLHGQGKAPQEYGILLNYICLIIWTSLTP